MNHYSRLTRAARAASLQNGEADSKTHVLDRVSISPEEDAKETHLGSIQYLAEINEDSVMTPTSKTFKGQEPPKPPKAKQK